MSMAAAPPARPAPESVMANFVEKLRQDEARIGARTPELAALLRSHGINIRDAGDNQIEYNQLRFDWVLRHADSTLAAFSVGQDLFMKHAPATTPKDVRRLMNTHSELFHRFHIAMKRDPMYAEHVRQQLVLGTEIYNSTSPSGETYVVLTPALSNRDFAPVLKTATTMAVIAKPERLIFGMVCDLAGRANQTCWWGTDLPSFCRGAAYQLCHDDSVFLSVAACSACHKDAAIGESFAKCARCHAARYCSKDCQKQHWKEHKLICTPG